MADKKTVTFKLSTGSQVTASEDLAKRLGYREPKKSTPKASSKNDSEK